MADSRKTKIIAKLLDICQPLLSDGVVRKIERKTSPFLNESMTPALHLVIGHEIVIYEDERGYNMEFPASFKMILGDGKDRETTGDRITAFLQEKVEADQQLANLCSKITYDGAYPYIDDVIPGGFVLVSYKIEYRRYRAHPERGY